MNKSENIVVWLIEDNASYRRSVARAIDSEAGMICGGDFDSFEAARQQFESAGDPDVVLLDVGLPGMDGIEALGEIRKLHAAANVIILTVFDDHDKIFRALCAGASGYLLKTSKVEEIADAIRQAREGGAPMTPKVASRVLEFFSKQPAARKKNSAYDLTAREQEILALMSEGLIKKEIADRLDISSHTVSTHLRSIYEKLHVNTNTGAVAKAIREKII